MYPSRFTEFFGPSMWKTMHAVAFTYPEEPTPHERKQYIDFFKSLEGVIPCPQCRQHYGEYIKSNPIHAEDTDDMSRWVYNLHDKVNKRNGKTSPSYQEVKDMYTGFNNNKHQALLAKSDEEQRKEMADPLFLAKTSDSPVVTTPSKSDDKNTRIILVLAIVAGMVFIYAQRKQRQKQKGD